MASDSLDEFLGGKKYPLDLIIIIIFSLVGAALSFALPDGNLIRILVSIPMLILFPGYILVSILWPKKEGLAETERIGLSIGLSLVVVAIIGLAINYFPYTLSQVPIVSMLLGFIIAGSILIFILRGKIPDDEMYVMDISASRLLGSDKNLAVNMITILLAIAVISITLFYVGDNSESYTNFYILDDEEMMVNYTSVAFVNESIGFIAVVESHQENTTIYSLNTTLEDMNGNNVSHISDREFVLADGEVERIDVDLIINNTGQYRLRFRLVNQMNNDVSDLHWQIRIE